MAKILIEREIQQIVHSSYISTHDFNNIYRKYASEPYCFLVNDTTVAPNNPLRFRKNLFSVYNKNHDN